MNFCLNIDAEKFQTNREGAKEDAKKTVETGIMWGIMFIAQQ